MSAVGLAIPASGIEDHFVAALAGALAEPLVRAGMTLVTKVVPDDASAERLHRHWARVGGVAGVALLGVRTGDPRVPHLRSLGFAVAGVVDATQVVELPAVVVDVAASVSVLRAFLATRRHERAVYLVGAEDRDSPFTRTVLEGTAEDGSLEVVHTEHGVEAAVAAARATLAGGPATLVFHSDVHAAAALAALRADGLRVPEDAAIVSWTNSTLCQSTSPSITAVNRRGAEIGLLLGERVLGALAGDLSTRSRAPEAFVVVGETA